MNGLSSSELNTGRVYHRDVPVSHAASKWKTYGFIIAMIVGIGGLAVAGAGIAGYFHVGALSNMAQIKAIIMMAVGGGGGTLLFIVGIVGMVKNRKTDNRPDQPQEQKKGEKEAPLEEPQITPDQKNTEIQQEKPKDNATKPVEEPGVEAHRDSSPGTDLETKLQGSSDSALKTRDGGVAQVQVQKAPIAAPKIISSKRAQKKLISQLPEWLSSYTTNVPYLQFEDRPLVFDDFENITNPVTLFSAGPTIGVYMRLRVNHVCVDSSYDRAPEFREEDHRNLQISSKNAFMLPIIVWPPIQNSTQWTLTSKRYPCIEHRNAPFELGNILGDERFHFRSEYPFAQEVVDQFLNTEKEDDLPKEYRYDLRWVLTRLFRKSTLEVRESRTDRLFHSFNEPVIGYWRISLDKKEN